ncbi:UNVERIFIED_CONTAM: hypothetical protein HDU68_005009 [Siphonaria sp. JEL0065]|nr:hypothetical protein HDU68_005009 [Siphonaria sp. JEL0065]
MAHQIALALEHYEAGRTDESISVLKPLLGSTSLRVRELACVLLVRQSRGIGEARGLWADVLGAWAFDWAHVPAGVAVAGILLFAAADNDTAERCFESWATAQSNPAKDTARYADLLRAYIRHVLVARADFDVAREFVSLNECITEDLRMSLMDEIQALELDSLREQAAKVASSIAASEEPTSTIHPHVPTILETRLQKHIQHGKQSDSSQKQLSEQTAVPHNGGDRIRATSPSKISKETPKSTVTSSIHPKSKNTPEKDIHSSPDCTAPALESVTPHNRTNQNVTAPVPSKPSIKVVLQYLKRNRHAIITFLTAFFAAVAYKYRDGPTVKAFIQLLLRFIKTLSMASSI